MSASDEDDDFFFSSSAASSAPPAAAGPAAPPPPPPPLETVVSRSLMSLPSRALAKRPGQYGSISTPAAVTRVLMFSACDGLAQLLQRFYGEPTEMAISSSWRMREAYVQAS
jgi:hypothetical protein